MDKEDGDATYTMGRCQMIIKPHVNMAKPLNPSKSTKSDWIEGASMTIGICFVPTSLDMWKRHYITFVLDCWHQKGFCDVKTRIFHLAGSFGGD